MVVVEKHVHEGWLSFGLFPPWCGWRVAERKGRMSVKLVRPWCWDWCRVLLWCGLLMALVGPR